MISRQFTLRLIARLVLIGLLMTGGVWLLVLPGYLGATLIVAIVLALSVAELWWFISRTNREVARFLNAARYADYSQRFEFRDDGAGFGVLGQTFADILARMRDSGSSQQAEMHRLRALIEHIPVPLMTLHGDASVTLQNNAARRLFGAEHVTHLRDLRKFGAGFAESVETAAPGMRQLVRFDVEGIEYKLTLAATELIVAGKSERLISLQDIQSELDATQAQAWEDLVKVLTHEIMNSITPVTSLAQTSSDLVEDVIRQHSSGGIVAEDLEDLHNAVRTVAKRSDSLLQFVDGYRQITRLSPPEKKRIRIKDLFDSALRLARAECPNARVAFSTNVYPQELTVYADRDLLEPVLINLLRNAWQACEARDGPEVRMSAQLNRRNNIVIEVSDNATGVPEDLARKIFVPFFTTKESGSGVGLALARQVMTAHGGFVRAHNNDSGGATFTLTF
jgi:nitrogen fixation/metabolism regulation signal transduction histidine kinase